jgi:hypothetical protein
LNIIPLSFAKSREASVQNAKILEKFEYDLGKLIASVHPSPLSFGSEFKSSTDLDELLHIHPYWSKLKDILNNGAKFPLLLISKKYREMDLDFHLNRGNHKSVEKLKEMMDPLVEEDIIRDFTLLLPIEILPKIPMSSLEPLGCHKQETVNETGVKIPKNQMTHDQCFPGPSGLSVNLRVKKEALPPIM